MFLQGFLISVPSKFFHEILCDGNWWISLVVSISNGFSFTRTTSRFWTRTIKWSLILSDMVFTQTPTLVELMQVVHLVMHAITASRPRDEIVRAQLSIIASVFRQSKSVLPVSALDSLKELVFIHPGVLKDVMMTSSSSEILQGNLNLLVSSRFLRVFQAYDLCQKC